MAVTYLDETAVIYPDETPNLSELENPRGVRFSRPETFNRLGGIIREITDRPIRPKVNKKPQAEVKRG